MESYGNMQQKEKKKYEKEGVGNYQDLKAENRQKEEWNWKMTHERKAAKRIEGKLLVCLVVEQ